jgi:hypothetical protein
MCSPSPPPAPDYKGAAKETAAADLEAARIAAKANRVNQYTPYGSLEYSQSGSDPDAGWSATQKFSPEQQAIFDQTMTLNRDLMGTANKGLSYASDILQKPGVDTSRLASVGFDPGQTYQDSIMSRLSPQIDRENAALDVKLANQGIAPGTEAYKQAKELQAQRQNDLLTSATVGGFNTGLAARQQGFQETAYNQMQPINVINALRTGSQVVNPNFVNVPQQATTRGADMLGATQAQAGYDQGAANAENQGNNNMIQGVSTVAMLF